MARRARLAATFRRSLATLGVHAKSPEYRAVFGAIAALADADELPGSSDQETSFAPGGAFVRRVSDLDAWLLYRFDAERLFVMTARGEPPVPGGT